MAFCESVIIREARRLRQAKIQSAGLRWASGPVLDCNSYRIPRHDRLSPRARSAAMRQNPRPSGRGGFTCPEVSGFVGPAGTFKSVRSHRAEGAFCPCPSQARCRLRE
jgi:hypothetical protein